MQLKQWLYENKIKQTEVAKRLAMDRSKMSRIVNKIENPTLFQAAAIYDITNGEVTLHDWIEGLKP